MNEAISDNRFEIIAKAKAHLLEATNIETREDEMKVLDNFLFRCWQMGWLDRYDEPQKKYPTEWCEQCNLWEDNKCLGVAHCKSNIKALKKLCGESKGEDLQNAYEEGYKLSRYDEKERRMKVKELIVRLLDEPMDAEIRLCTDYDKEEVETHGCVRVVNRGVIFAIDEIEHWTNDCININFTDWRKNE